MLQIITEKFYRLGERYETLHRAVFYTNYRMLMRAGRMETPIGVLLPTTGLEGLAAMTCEMLEKIEKHPDGDQPGVMISTGGASLLNDFAAVTAFALDITCTPDPDLTRRLLATERPSLGVQAVPSELIKRTFDRKIISKDSDAPALAQFVTQLVGLERKRFEGAMRSIRQYVTGLHRIADNVSLAYTLLVMSVESLAQNFDGHVAEWSDYEHRKRERIDAALEGAPDEVGDRVRTAVLANEHIAAARRFRDFALTHIAPSFFREEAAQTAGPISRDDLTIVLRQAYVIRSSYVHTLQEAPSSLTMGRMPELVDAGDRPALSIAGLARVTRHIIMQFVVRGPFLEREEFDYRRSLPNVVSLRLAPEYWIANTGGFTYKHGPQKLSAFIGQITSVVLLRTPNAHVTDMRPVLELVEKIVPGLQDFKQRLPLLTLYFLFHTVAGEQFHCKQWPELIEKHKSDFDQPSMESFVAHLCSEQPVDWTIEQLEAVQRDYFKSRHRTDRTNIGRLLEAAFLLYAAEMHRKARNEERAHELVALSVDAHPGHTALRAFEAAFTGDPLPEIDWQKVLLPPPPVEAEQPNDEEGKHA
jgi:hypothetical protein